MIVCAVAGDGTVRVFFFLLLSSSFSFFLKIPVEFTVIAQCRPFVIEWMHCTILDLLSC